MSAATPLGLVVLSGEWARVHYALMMASSAAAIDRPVTLFVTMDAVPLLEAGEGWRRLAGAEGDDTMKQHKVADTETLLEACAAMDVTIMVCEAGLKARDVAPSALRSDIGVDVTGLVTFYRSVGTGQIVAL